MMWYVVSICGKSIEDISCKYIAYEMEGEGDGEQNIIGRNRGGDHGHHIIGPGGGTLRMVLLSDPHALNRRPPLQYFLFCT